MPIFELKLQAILENVSSISAPADYSWSFEFTCGRCGEVSPKPVTFTADQEVELVRGGKATLMIKCKFCERTSDVLILEGEHVYKDTGEFRPFMAMECRGTSPSSWQIIEDLVVTGENGFVFPDSAIENGEFYGYDENLNQEASVTEFEHKIERRR